MSIIKKENDIENLRQAGRMLAKILDELKLLIGPGVSTGSLDKKARQLIEGYGAKPSFLGYENFPAALCVSVNSEIVHCIPSDSKIVKDGDIVSLDLGLEYKGMYVDAAFTQAIGSVDKRVVDLILVTRHALEAGINEASAGNKIGDISFAIQQVVLRNNMSIIRDLVGHGTGYGVHNAPQIPNFGKPGHGSKIEEGMVLAIEPMVSMGSHEIKKGGDGYGFVTSDGSLAAHFEHTVLVGENGVEILT